MIVEAPDQTATSQWTFPAAELRRRLEAEVQQAADESVVLHGGWKPVLDSRRLVSVVLTVEDLFPFRIPPEKVVRRGGYSSVTEAVDDLFERIVYLWIIRGERNESGCRR
jgi:hypothetical protein